MFGGDTEVGKTLYLQRLIGNYFNEDTPSTLAPYFGGTIDLEIKNLIIHFTIFDTINGIIPKAGDYIKRFLEKNNGILLLFSFPSGYRSFENLDYCIEIMDKSSISSSNILVLLEGTSADKKDIKVKSEDAINYAKKHNFKGYFEFSSKTGKNVYSAFEFITYFLYQLTFERKTKIKFKIKIYNNDKAEDDVIFSHR